MGLLNILIPPHHPPPPPLKFLCGTFLKHSQLCSNCFTVIFAHFLQMTWMMGYCSGLSVSPKPMKLNQNLRLLNLFSKDIINLSCAYKQIFTVRSKIQVLKERVGLYITTYACCKSLLRFTVKMVFSLPAKTKQSLKNKQKYK